MVEVKNLTKRYGQNLALDRVSFTVDEGSIVGFLGPNGAGKTTTMNIITGYLSATSGEVTVFGKNTLEEPNEVKKMIGYLPEQPPLYLDMTVKEYLNFMYELKKVKLPREKHIKEICELVQISNVYNRLIGNLSKGYKQRVGIAQALLGDPKVIILDEPTVGLDPRQIIEIRDLIQSLAESHTVILSSHILSEVQAVCHTILIISGGKLVACDTPENLEKLFAGTTTVELTAECTEAEARSILAPIGAERLTVTGQDDGRCQAVLETGGDDSVCRDIFFAFSRAGRPILRMTTARASLEDIFIELTAGQADAQAEPLADGAEDEEFQLDYDALLEDPGAPGKEDDET
ncbi:MAG TPA: ABC transporter ATP-binding protein [Candidatus Acutalibacter stercorigallinarum]|nr:ABC transporter ATP-binding protein [Candidatus Acutalibacter stercorigallinarum]